MENDKQTTEFIREKIPKQSETKIVINDKVESENNSLTSPPDGGFGWIIVFASFMCNVIVDGIIFSFGILLLEIAKEFNENRSNTSWIGSLQAGFYLTAGPAVSVLANKFGCQRVTIFGSVLASVGFILSYFANDIKVLYLTFGVLGGIGFGFIFLPAIVTVGFYFERKRAFATGIAVCGSGVGAFIMAPFVQYLVESYGWRGCVLILGGITLNCAVFGSLFRPVEESANFSSQKSLLIQCKDAIWNEEPEKSPTQSQNSAPPPYSEIDNFYVKSKSQEEETLLNQMQLNYKTQTNYQDETLGKPRSKSFDHNNTVVKSIFGDETLYNAMSLFALKQESTSYKSLNNQVRSESKRSLETISSISLSSSCFSSLKDMFDLSLLSSPAFLILAISGFLCLAGFFIPFMYIADRAIILGCTQEKAAFLLSVIGITNTVGRVFCGWISDHPKVNALIINNVALTIGGTVTFLSPIFFNTYASLIVYGAIFGFSIACFAALRSVITVQLLGLERLTNAFGLLLLFQGVATILGSPLAGWFFDMTGSYDYSFYLSGSAITISGLMCFALPSVSNWEKHKANHL